MAELVDAQVSEACSRKGVEVRFFSSALIYFLIVLPNINKYRQNIAIVHFWAVAIFRFIPFYSGFRVLSGQNAVKIAKPEYGETLVC